MTTTRRPLRRASRGALSSDQEQCLWLGVGRNGFPFEDEEEAREAWERHKARIMASYAKGGRRPQAWWVYDAPEGLEFDYDTERSTLFEAGLLEVEEAAVLIAFWREQFDRCHAPDFTYCGGPGQFLKGREATRAHLAWADVPASLVKKWSAERRSAYGPPAQSQ